MMLLRTVKIVNMGYHHKKLRKMHLFYIDIFIATKYNTNVMNRVMFCIINAYMSEQGHIFDLENLVKKYQIPLSNGDTATLTHVL